MSDFNALKFVADNAGLNIFKALEKAYEQGKADAAKEALIDKDIDVPNKWIPVSEKMPERGGYYLVTEKISEECWFVGLAPYRSTCERWFGDHEVTAWMPLPEPYKEGEENGNVN